MHLSVHFITSLCLTAILWPLIGPYSFWAIVGGFLIDFDHYLYTGWKYKMWRIKDQYLLHINYLCKKAKKNREILHVFHTVEFWAVMILTMGIAYLNEWTFIFYMVAVTFLGMMMHVILDVIGAVRTDKIGIRAISMIWWINKFWIKKENNEK